MSIRLLIADEFELVRLGLKRFFEGTDIKIVAQATTGKEAIELAAKYQPDVVLLEASLPGLDGPTVIVRVKSAAPAVKMILFTAHENPMLAAKVRALGGDGFLDKRSTRAELLRAIQAAVAGEPAFSRTELRRMRTAMAHAPGFDNLEASLSARELAVLKIILTGATNTDIAGHLKLSYEMTKQVVQEILAKLGVEDRIQAVLWAIRAGALSAELPEQ